MAGSYPDVPSRRMAYDTDGSIGTTSLINESGSIYELSAGNMSTMNDESETATSALVAGSYTARLAIIFPELRDIYGVFCATQYSTPGELATSVDTTSSRDGNWTVQVADLTDYSIVAVNYRTGIDTSFGSAIGARSVRVKFPTSSGSFNYASCKALHIYGGISAGETPDRLLYIDSSTGLEYTGPVDWGDIPRGTVYDETWYIKNNSSSLTANNTNIDVEALYNGSEAFYTFSTGVGWSTGLGPVSTIGASSRWPPSNSLTIRCDPPSTAPLGLHAARIILATSSWS